MGQQSGRKGPDPRPITDRFWEKTRITPAPDGLDLDGPCLLWTAATQRGGYGKFGLGRGEGTVLAHRFAWWLIHAEWPQLHLDHLCMVKTCVSVAHLEPVTAGENNRRRAATVTHCPAGHPYDEANTYRRPGSGARTCRACHRAAELTRYHQMKEIA